MTALRNWAVALAMVMLLVSAIAQVYLSHQARLIFSEIGRQKAELKRLEDELDKSNLELAAFTREKYVEMAAFKKLRLINPKHEEIIYLKPR